MLKILAKLNLTPEDLYLNEDILEERFRNYLSFKSLSLFFPPEPPQAIRLLESEKKLFIPLQWHGRNAGVALLSGVDSLAVRRLEPWLMQIASACLQAIVLARRIRIDPDTGLHTEDAFFEDFELRLAMLKDIPLEHVGLRRGSPGQNASIGFLLFSLHDAANLIRQFDHEVCERLMQVTARSLASALPQNAAAARLAKFEGRHEFGVLFPAFGRKSGRELANRLLKRFDRLEILDPATAQKAKARFSAGHAIFPQDMQGNEFVLPALHQALRLCGRARYAAQTAVQGERKGDRILAYAEILRNGGFVVRNAGHGKLKVNLGSDANAREGMRFVVRGLGHDGKLVEKGQLVLLQTGPRESYAEVLYLSKPGLEPEEGDRLELMAPGDGLPFHQTQQAEAEGAANILQPVSHGNFIRAFKGLSRDCARFTLSIARIDQAGPDSWFYRKLEQLANSETEGLRLPDYSALYGSNGLIFFHKEAGADEAMVFAQEIATLAESCGCEFACGIFAFPFLGFSRDESEASALKALEFAQLLPAPHIGVFGSVALTISGDRLFSLGETFAAIHEYEQAILADPENAMALTSLGVCMCSLGKNGEGRRRFLEALQVTGDPAVLAKSYYNLGTLALKDGDGREAVKYFRQCIAHDRNHVFAFLRLGQALQSLGRLGQARRYIRHAIRAAGDDSGMRTMAERQLAALESLTDRKTATGMLHDTLVRNPRDPGALNLMAQLYLQNSEDSPTAERLARESLRLGGGTEALAVLRKALEMQGRAEEASVLERRSLERRDF